MPGPLLAAGREADVFDLGDGRVLRRYRTGADATREAVVMRHLRAAGYPVPEVFAAEGTDLVLERLHGPTMLEAVIAGGLGPAEVGGVLAELHAALHAVPWGDADGAGAEGPADGGCVVHLDLHPINVMMTAGGPVVIDWHQARAGEPALDVAVTALILAVVGVDPAHPLAPLAMASATAFVAAARADLGSPLDDAVGLRRREAGLPPAETALLASAVARLRG